MDQIKPAGSTSPNSADAGASGSRRRERMTGGGHGSGGSGGKAVVIVLSVILALGLAAAVFFIVKAARNKKDGSDPGASVTSPAPTETAASDTAEPTWSPASDPTDAPAAPTEVPSGEYDDTRWAIVSTVTYDEDGVPSDEKKRTVTVSGKHVITADPEQEDIDRMLSTARDPEAIFLYFPPEHEGEWFQPFYDPENQKDGLRKFNGEELVWRKYYGIRFTELKEYGEHLVMSGYREKDGGNAELIMMDRDGNIIWRKAYYRDDRPCVIFDILFEEDGSIAVFGKSAGEENTPKQKYDTFFFRRYSHSGELVTATESAEDDELLGCFCRVEPMGDGFVISIRHWAYETSYIKWDVTTVDHDGRLLRSFDFSKLVDSAGERKILGISYASYHNGLLYVSGYATRCGDGGEHNYLDSILFEKNEDGRYAFETLDRAELGRIARKFYTAVLFTVDPATGEVKSMISVDGGIGMETSENENGELVWKVLDIFTCSYASGSSVTPYNYAGLKTAYILDETGNVVLVSKTDEGDVMYR